MMDARVERQLAAILMLDVVGYSRLMGEDEEGTLGMLKHLRRKVVSPQIAAYRGRIVKVMGDGAIVIFSSIIDATNAAIAVQQAMARQDAELPNDERIQLRIGLNLGDVIRDGTDIYGDGVNIAARLQEVCVPGGVVLSAGAYDHVRGKTAENFSNGGERQLKNIAQPIRVYIWPPEAIEAESAFSEAPALPDRPSVVVLPFDNMSDDQNQEYFADGVVEALTAALSRIRSFFVIARNSAFAYKGTHKNVGQIGRELGVAYLLEGSVQRAPGRLRITVQLIETATGNHLWAERYCLAPSFSTSDLAFLY